MPAILKPEGSGVVCRMSAFVASQDTIHSDKGSMKSILCHSRQDSGHHSIEDAIDQTRLLQIVLPGYKLDIDDTWDVPVWYRESKKNPASSELPGIPTAEEERASAPQNRPAAIHSVANASVVAGQHVDRSKLSKGALKSHLANLAMDTALASSNGPSPVTSWLVVEQPRAGNKGRRPVGYSSVSRNENKSYTGASYGQTCSDWPLKQSSVSHQEASSLSNTLRSSQTLPDPKTNYSRPSNSENPSNWPLQQSPKSDTRTSTIANASSSRKSSVSEEEDRFKAHKSRSSGDSSLTQSSASRSETSSWANGAHSHQTSVTSTDQSTQSEDRSFSLVQESSPKKLLKKAQSGSGKQVSFDLPPSRTNSAQSVHKDVVTADHLCRFSSCSSCNGTTSSDTSKVSNTNEGPPASPTNQTGKATAPRSKLNEASHSGAVDELEPWPELEPEPISFFDNASSIGIDDDDEDRAKELWRRVKSTLTVRRPGSRSGSASSSNDSTGSPLGNVYRSQFEQLMPLVAGTCAWCVRQTQLVGHKIRCVLCERLRPDAHALRNMSHIS